MHPRNVAAGLGRAIIAARVPVPRARCIHLLTGQRTAWARRVLRSTKPTRIREFQRAVIHIAVPVESLTVERCRHRGIGADEPSNGRVIHPSVHIHQAQVVELLLVRIAAVGVVALPIRCNPIPEEPSLYAKLREPLLPRLTRAGHISRA